MARCAETEVEADIFAEMLLSRFAEDRGDDRDGAPPADRYCNCFISYSSVDDEFASKLYDDLMNNGINCWKWDIDARIGQPLWAEITSAIHGNDKVLLIVSNASLRSPSVNREIERTLRLEDARMLRRNSGEFEGDVNVLFPVRLDDFVITGWEHERRDDIVSKVIADASAWRSGSDAYQSVLDRIMRDLHID